MNISGGKIKSIGPLYLSKAMFRSVEGQKSNRFIMEGDSQADILPKPDATIK